MVGYTVAGLTRLRLLEISRCDNVYAWVQDDGAVEAHIVKAAQELAPVVRWRVLASCLYERQ